MSERVRGGDGTHTTMVPSRALEHRIVAANGTSIAYRVFADDGASDASLRARPTLVLSNGIDSDRVVTI